MTPNSRLDFTPDEMRRFGYQTIDLLVEHFAGLANGPVASLETRAALDARLAGPPPELASDPGEVLKRLERDVLSSRMRVDHPRFFAFVPSPGNFAGAMADALVSGLNIFAGTWMAGSGPIALEMATVRWLADACGMPASAGGLFVSGGSMANLTALAAARHAMLDDRTEGAMVYYSDQTHSSVERALRTIGFAAEQLRKLPSDDSYQLPAALLAEAVSSDRRAGLRPFAVVANAGTTNTGAVDPLPALGSFCRKEGLWLHADGAYGAASCLSARGRAALDGIGEVDSLSLDPHKWLFQPFECGCVVVRDAELLRRTFRITPEYLQDVHRLSPANLCDYGVQLTRGLRALKLWMSIQIFGMQAFREAIDRGFQLAEYAEQRLRRMPGWDIVSPAQMAVVSFRYTESTNRSEELVKAMYQDGYAMLTSTVLKGQTALRLCTINPRTTEADLDRTLARLDHLARA
ncbi:MAG: aminotransferase class V-fold PLP-dependent enzyme [Bryobacterales bacterium]|nr:aminotransferase class V-fold PLP-dependent enzyme [Bryobacterales bacterium]